MMIILHFDLQPQFKYMNYFIYTSHQNIFHKYFQSLSVNADRMLNKIFLHMDKDIHFELEIKGMYTNFPIDLKKN